MKDIRSYIYCSRKLNQLRIRFTSFKRIDFLTSNNRSEKGFTIIELLIVIALIGVMATIAILGLSGQTEKARDAKRKGDLEEVQNALLLYYNHFNHFPTNDASTFEIEGCGTGSTACAWGGPFTANSNVYMTTLPSDPLCEGAGCTTQYRYVQNTNDSYTLTACLEFAQDPNCIGTVWCGCSYSVTFN